MLLNPLNRSGRQVGGLGNRCDINVLQQRGQFFAGHHGSDSRSRLSNSASDQSDKDDDDGDDNGVWPPESPMSSLRDILAVNLRRLIAKDGGSVRAWALARELDVRLIDRLSKGQHAVTLDKLDEIAAACGLKPWHLLVEGMDPASPPEKPISADDQALISKLRRLLDAP